MAVHLDISSGMDYRTACGKSLHGWYVKRPKETTEDRREVTCKNCIRNMNKLGY